ncbi:MAG: NADH-quinone oxidoreductase subunit C [Planctomycetota bacterium]
MSTLCAGPCVANGDAVGLDKVPSLPIEEFREVVIDHVREGNRVHALFGGKTEDGGVSLTAVLGDPNRGLLQFLTSSLQADTYPSLTPECPQVHWFEREIAEQWGVVPEGHPWLKPIRFHPSYRHGNDAWGRPPQVDILPSVTNFFRVDGEEVHEVAVGPVHAGVIEPGHFRFQCHGEQVFHLEISLGYQHRGVERALVGGPNKRTIHYIETLAGDTSVGHSLAYCQVVEGLANVRVSPRAQALRAIALEMERLPSHTGDLGALADDVGYLPTASFCGRLRGDFLNSFGIWCGSRFGRGLIRPGGVQFDVTKERVDKMLKRMNGALPDVAGAAKLLWNTPSVQARFENTGAVTPQIAEKLRLVGPAMRACGFDHDVRHDYPSGFYRYVIIPVATCPSGDVFARAYVRWMEIQRSMEFINQELADVPGGEPLIPVGALRPRAMVASLTEGWRGEICHVAVTDDRGRFAQYKVIDPSFHNWIGLAMALRDQQISDFPLCNKSFNLSYCGHDL